MTSLDNIRTRIKLEEAEVLNVRMCLIDKYCYYY